MDLADFLIKTLHKRPFEVGSVFFRIKRASMEDSKRIYVCRVDMDRFYYCSNLDLSKTGNTKYWNWTKPGSRMICEGFAMSRGLVNPIGLEILVTLRPPRVVQPDFRPMPFQFRRGDL